MANRLFEWCVDAGASQTTSFSVNTIQFADGYEQDSTTGINNVTKRWSCAKTGYKTEVEAVYLFLLEHRGFIPFDISLDGDLITCKTVGEIDKPHISGKVWRLSFTIKQVHLPEVI